MIKRLFQKYKELISYGFWGLMTTVVNYAVYLFCLKLCGVNYLISNIIAWIIAVAFAYVTNKLYVFRSDDWSFDRLKLEVPGFVGGRLFSLAVESLLLYVFVDLLACRSDIIKIFTNIIVIILNYFFAKFLIFRKKRDGNG